MKHTRKSLSVAIATVFLGAAASGVTAESVWHEGYEQYIDKDFEHFTVTAQPMPGSDRLVWDQGYEDFVPENMPRFRITREFGPLGDYNPGGYSLQYEQVFDEGVGESGDSTEGLARGPGAADTL